jgi:hypothetical protein
MQSAARKLLVVGGNGFIGKLVTRTIRAHAVCTRLTRMHSGSAVCRTALLRGFEVTSIRYAGAGCEGINFDRGPGNSSSGRPFRTSKGHAPAWTAKVCRFLFRCARGCCAAMCLRPRGPFARRRTTER